MGRGVRKEPQPVLCRRVRLTARAAEGEVLRASDTRLGQRWAAVNHPDIGAIHGLEEAEGQKVLDFGLVRAFSAVPRTEWISTSWCGSRKGRKRLVRRADGGRSRLIGTPDRARTYNLRLRRPNHAKLDDAA